MKILKRNPFAVFFLLFLLGRQTEGALPKDAQAAIKKGVYAYKLGDEKVQNGNPEGGLSDYKVAINYFQEARELAPDANQAYLDLGIEESKIPGRELRAMAWFGAYLSINPKGENAKKVKGQIDLLEVKYKSNLRNLVQRLQKAAIKISDNQVLVHVADYWAELGEIPSAMHIVDLFEGNHYKDCALRRILQHQCEKGDIEGAKVTMGLIQDGTDGCLREIAEAQTFAGDCEGSSVTLHRVAKNQKEFDLRMGDIAEDLVDCGEIQGALKAVGYIKNQKDDQNIKLDDQFLTLSVCAASEGDLIDADKFANLITHLTYNKKKAFEYIEGIRKGEKAQNHPQNKWLCQMDGKNIRPSFDFGFEKKLNLNNEEFLDLDSYLEELSNKEDPEKFVYRFYCSVEKIIFGFTDIEIMLKKQSKQKVIPNFMKRRVRFECQ